MSDLISEHYNRPEIKAVILSYCSTAGGFRALNANEGWYKGSRDPSMVMIRGPADYDATIKRGRTLYATLDVMEPKVFEQSERWIEDLGTPEHPIGTLENCLAFTLSTDIDAVGDIQQPDIKEAVEAAAQFHVDYLRAHGISKSVHCLYSGGGIYVHIHHALWAEESIDEPEVVAREYRILCKAYNKVIADIEKEFFKKYPQYAGKVKFDKLNNQKRTFKVIFSVHKRLPYAVIPLNPAAIKIDFDRASLPLSNEVLEEGKNWYTTFDLSEKGAVFALIKDKIGEIQNTLKDNSSSDDDEISRMDSPLPMEQFPPCIKNIINNAQNQEGRHRALGILATYLYQAGWDEDMAFNLWAHVADRCGVEPRIFETEFGRMKCPLCETINKDTGGYPNLNLYKLGFCVQDDGCKYAIWPGDYGRERPRSKMTLTRNNRGNVERLIELHGEDLKYVKEYKDWVTWDGTRWVRDETAPFTCLDDVVRSLYEEARSCENDAERDERAKFASRCGNHAVYQATANLASKNPWFSCSVLDMDNDDYVLNTKSGLLDLNTFILRPHHYSQMIMKSTGYKYDPKAECPRWEQFQDEWSDNRPELVKYMRRLFGYALTGSMVEKTFFLLYGSEGDNGKSVLLEIIRAMCGDYAKNADIGTFLLSRNDKVRDDLAALYGARVVTAAEPEEGSRFSMAMIKPWTGSDPITCRELFGKIFSYKPKGKIFISANNKPAIYERSNAAWNRVHLIPFDVTFSKEKKDKLLASKLKKELPGILNWSLEGLRDYRTKGGLMPPQIVCDEVQAYRKENDSVRQFVEEVCSFKSHYCIAGKDLFNSYRAYCLEAGLRPLGRSKFNGVMLPIVEEHGGHRERDGVGNMYFGIIAPLVSAYKGYDLSDAYEGSQGECKE